MITLPSFPFRSELFKDSSVTTTEFLLPLEAATVCVESERTTVCVAPFAAKTPPEEVDSTAEEVVRVAVATVVSTEVLTAGAVSTAGEVMMVDEERTADEEAATEVDSTVDEDLTAEDWVAGRDEVAEEAAGGVTVAAATRETTEKTPPPTARLTVGTDARVGAAEVETDAMEEEVVEVDDDAAREIVWMAEVSTAVGATTVDPARPMEPVSVTAVSAPALTSSCTTTASACLFLPRFPSSRPVPSLSRPPSPAPLPLPSSPL